MARRCWGSCLLISAATVQLRCRRSSSSSSSSAQIFDLYHYVLSVPDSQCQENYSELPVLRRSQYNLDIVPSSTAVSEHHLVDGRSLSRSLPPCLLSLYSVHLLQARAHKAHKAQYQRALQSMRSCEIIEWRGLPLVFFFKLCLVWRTWPLGDLTKERRL